MANRCALALAGAMLLGAGDAAARDSSVPAIFVNATDNTVVIHFQTWRPTSTDGRTWPCMHTPPQSTPQVVSGWTWDDERWSPAAGAKFDSDTCVTEMTVAGRSSVLVQINGMCDDYQTWLRRNPAVRPVFESFQVQSSDRFVLLKGWDTAKVFERSWDACIYRFD